VNTLNETHDIAVRSFVASANEAGGDFPLQNLPFGVVRRRNGSEPWRGAVAIGDLALDLAALARASVVTGDAAQPLAACNAPVLNAFMAMGAPAWSRLRRALWRVLRHDAPERARVQQCLIPQSEVEHALPARIGDYTDFYASVHHANSVGRMFRPDQPLMPNYKWVPIAYHGRASSIGVSPQRFHRPIGQRLPPGAERPVVGPTQRLDYELELGIVIGAGNALGTRVAVGAAESHVFGLCLLNDWSAREIQAWEYQPLGPFLAKNFATTISPWIVTLEALAPYRLPFSRPAGDPEPLEYLDAPGVRARGALDIELEAQLSTSRMRAAGQPPHTLSRSNYRHAYWTVAQLVAHHTINGCNLEPGDLLGTGTQSGPEPAEAGSLLELTAGGKRPLTLPDGETRAFLEDGDVVTLRAWCERAGAARIGFGAAVGEVLPPNDKAC
jgi:fumarylacetoacetase